jgi:hypothetical protein
LSSLNGLPWSSQVPLWLIASVRDGLLSPLARLPDRRGSRIVGQNKGGSEWPLLQGNAYWCRPQSVLSADVRISQYRPTMHGVKIWIFILITIEGCTGNEWSHLINSQERADQDLVACRRWAATDMREENRGNLSN